jgi:asparagine synthase (glutamine-hydrolysing)
MCGIALMVDRKNKAIDKKVLELMTNKVIHRGPDDSGDFIDGAIGLGHRRLSIIDLSACGKQPMFFEQLSIVFNGEIYNYIELKEELKSYGYKFASNSDTEVLLIAYHHWGKDCVNKLRGMWAFVIYDSTSQSLFLSRDRFGIKPLHYTQTPTKFLAGSEIKQFTVVEDFEAKMFHPIVYEFLYNSVLNHNEFTFYKDVFSLPAGHNLIYNLKNHEFTIEKWYDIRNVSRNLHAKKNDAAELFRSCFEEAIKIHLRSDVKLGSCLSGGLDSSSIVSVSRKILGQEKELYTITSCSDSAAFDERQYAQEVALANSTRAIYTTPDLNELYTENTLEKIAYYHDQPIATGSHFAEYKVFEEAHKNKLIVMLDGQGSDEYLAGYHNFFLYRCKGLLAKGKWKTLHRTIRERAANRGIPIKSICINLLKIVLQKPIRRWKPEKMNKVPWLNEKWVHKQRPSQAATYERLSAVNNLYEMSVMAIERTSIPYQLHSEDRNSMIFSVESRVPFLDHVLVEAMLGMPEDNYYTYGLDKIPIREGLKEILPEMVYKRRTKLGFASSDEVWMKEHCQEVRARLRRAIDYFPQILNMSLLLEFDKFLSGKSEYNSVFFRVLSLYAWAKSTNMKVAE